MQVDTAEVIKKMKALLADVQYELLAHQVAVDVLERDKSALKEELDKTNLELTRLKRESESQPGQQ